MGAQSTCAAAARELNLIPYENKPTILSRTISNLHMAAKGIRGVQESLTNVVPSNDHGNPTGGRRNGFDLYVTAIKQEVVKGSCISTVFLPPLTHWASMRSFASSLVSCNIQQMPEEVKAALRALPSV